MRSEPVLFPGIYPWYVLVAYLDVVLTWAILGVGGAELNPFAASVIEHGGLGGMACFKSLTMVIVLASCEYIGRVRYRTGFRLATFAAAANTFPVVVGVSELGVLAGFFVLRGLFRGGWGRCRAVVGGESPP